MGLTFYERRKLANPALFNKARQRDVIARDRDKTKFDVYNCVRWRNIRRRMMSAYPTCPDPFGVHGSVAVPSAEVHHIVPLGVDMGLAYDLSNLIPLCQSCHAKADDLDRKDPTKQRGLMLSAVARYNGK